MDVASLLVESKILNLFVSFLAEKDIGESVVCPSSRGPSFLTLTLKVYDGIYAHKDILESGKEHKDIASLLRIGKTLKIGDDTFEDLDEVKNFIFKNMLMVYFTKYGTTIAPRLYAPVYQHFFISRMDMAVDCKPGEAYNQVTSEKNELQVGNFAVQDQIMKLEELKERIQR